MEFNVSEFKSNVTVDQAIDYLYFNVTTINQTEGTQIHSLDLYEVYKTIEKKQILSHTFLSYILGALIILSNLTVVISSGLILSKGQQPKSTYLLLGNVSLSDTLIGFLIVFGISVDNTVSYGPLCVFQVGMIVCQTKVSIFSVGLLAVDRYIYILHGLYYKRWFNTTRVRIGILCSWIIGVTLGFLPATGWTINSDLILRRCYFVSLFPRPLILFNAILSIVPVIVVWILYSIILVKALKNVKNLKSGAKHLRANVEERDKLKLRIDRGTVDDKPFSAQSVKFPQKPDKLFRSGSFNSGTYNKVVDNNLRSVKPRTSKSIDDITDANQYTNNHNRNTDNNQEVHHKGLMPNHNSASSVYNVESESNISDQNSSTGELKKPRINHLNKPQTNAGTRKLKEPNKWRAITVVMLTTGSFTFTWIPYYITVILFMFCEDKLNPTCLRYWTLLGRVLPVLALSNCLLNPLIYAWWHKGFQKSVKMYYKKYVHKHIRRAAT